MKILIKKFLHRKVRSNLTSTERGQEEDTSLKGLDPRLRNFREDATLLVTVKSLILGPHPQFSLSRLWVASGKPHFLNKMLR